MPEKAGIAGVVGLFDDPEAIVAAAQTVRDAGWKRWDCHTPYPVHGLDRSMGLGASWIPVLAIPAGFCGALFAKAMQWYMSDFDYPLMVGGKPLFSLPAFTPVAFELFVLFAAVTTFACLILFCRLGRWHSPLHDAGVMAQVTSSRFAIYIEAADPRFSEEAARATLEAGRCTDIRTIHDDDGATGTGANSEG